MLNSSSVNEILLKAGDYMQAILYPNSSLLPAAWCCLTVGYSENVLPTYIAAALTIAADGEIDLTS